MDPTTINVAKKRGRPGKKILQERERIREQMVSLESATLSHQLGLTRSSSPNTGRTQCKLKKNN